MLARTICALTACSVLAAAASAETADEGWQFRASLYGYTPNISGTLRTATPAGSTIDVEAEDLVRNTKFAAMGSFEAARGRWGGFADVIYMNVGDSIDDSTSLALGSVPLPPGVTADASLDVKASALTLALEYRVLESDSITLDAFAGARHLDVSTEARIALSAAGAPIPDGSIAHEYARDGWDGLVGVKGRWTFGAREQWLIPYYIDGGTGAADRTFQAFSGIGYAARWGEVFATWRYLDYDLADGAGVRDLQFSGPSVGVAIEF